MTFRTWMTVAALMSLGACANSPDVKPDYAAKNRPLEERCARLQGSAKLPFGNPNKSHGEVQTDAQKATARGELDKACDWL